MKMQKYIRIILALVLIISNLSVAFSMHLCQGSVEEIKLNYFGKEIHHTEQKSSCCADKKVVKHCKNSEEEVMKDDCCQDLSISDEIQTQQYVPVFKLSSITFSEIPVVRTFEFPDVIDSISSFKFLDSYTESNAPPIYILHSQLIVYEA